MDLRKEGALVSDEEREVFFTAVDAWNAGDGERYLELYDPSIAITG